MIKKRGQITLFIIIGIVILLAGGIALYLREKTTLFRPPIVVPPELVPIKSYIESCMSKEAEDALNILGMNGGFIEFPDVIANDPFSYISVLPGSSLKNPYWFYEGINRTPTIGFMQNELSNYVLKNLPECINSLESFKEEYDIEQRGDMAVITTLNEEGVLVELNYPLKIKSRSMEEATDIEDFTITAPVRLKKLYELANRIMSKENDDYFVEKMTIDLLAMDPKIPYTDVAFTCDRKTWLVANVTSRLKYLLMNDLPLINIKNTAYEPIPEERTYEQTHYIIDAGSLPMPSTHVNFYYDERWPMHLYVRPSSGGVLKSNSQKGQEMLSWFCMHVWHFTYDIIYPVIATITDDETATHKAYTFSFAFTASINHNRPDRTNFGIAAFDLQYAAKSDDYCSKTLRNEITVRTWKNISGEATASNIDNVNITFTCLRYRCDMGQTKPAQQGATSELTAAFPYCVNGVLRGNKKGYMEGLTFTSTEEEKTVNLYLIPVNEIANYTIVKHPSTNPALQKNLGADEKAVILARNDEMNIDSSVSYPSDIEMPITLLKDYDFSYDIKIYLIKDDKIIGGYSGSWNVPSSEIRYAKSIKFHVMEYPAPETEDDMFSIISNIAADSGNIAAPELK